MNTFMKYYKIPTILWGIGIALGGYIGFVETGTITGLIEGLVAVMILSVLEVSLSADNAVLNAKKLADMDEVWKKRFLTWGMLIAVFGMRLVLPILIVAGLGEMTPWHAVWLGFNDPKQYAEVLQSSHHLVASFGGAFLLMVALGFFLDDEKDNHWLGWIEKPLSKMGGSLTVQVGITLVALIAASFGAEQAERVPFLASGAVGVLLFLGIHLLSEWLEAKDEAMAKVTGMAVKSGLAGFIYLEILDASMSFDGLIAAFAITQYFLVIMIGLGIGALFVRSMTLHVLESGHMGEYRYMENGAFFAILCLAVIMLLNFVFEVPEVVTGLIGVAFLGAAVYHSHVLNKKEALEEATE